MALILLIDDDPLVGDVVSASLQSAGHVVGVLTDGQSALQVIEAKRPALVLLDCAMPLVPGLEVLRQIRLSRHSSRLPVLMLTARGQTRDRGIAMRAGATAYMSRPFEPEVLAMKADEMISDSWRESPAMVRPSPMVRYAWT